MPLSRCSWADEAGKQSLPPGEVESPEKAASTMKQARDIDQRRAMVNATGEEFLTHLIVNSLLADIYLTST